MTEQKLKKPRVDIPDGYELRGFKFKIYPTMDDERKLASLEDDMRYAWNWMCSGIDTWLEAGYAQVVRAGLMEPRPQRPDYVGMNPEESEQAKKAHTQAIIEWSSKAYTHVKKLSSPLRMKDWCEHLGMAHDYQVLHRVITWREREREIHAGAHLLQALFKNWNKFGKGQRRKKFRRTCDSMPVQTGSGMCFIEGDFGERGGNPKFYNCMVKINGLKIRGRLPGRRPTGRVIEGVALVREPDGWYASIKECVPKRTLPTPEVGTVVGIDVGLDNLVAYSEKVEVEGRLTAIIANPRLHQHAQKLAELEATAQTSFRRETGKSSIPSKQVARLQNQIARHVRHKIYTEVLKPLAKYETIAVENLSSKIGQMGSRTVSSMRTIVAMLKERYGDRVREVPAPYTSQRCSQCAKCDDLTADGWSYTNGPIGQCPYCGYADHRDLNAARNIRDKYLNLW